MNGSEASVGAWAAIDGDCPIEYVVCRDEVEFRFGGRDGFELFVTEQGLRRLADISAEALTAMREKTWHT
ncbi:hypothetical protein SAMN06265360_12612 [Haloechinothrix alba]|uniref:Uncharacterized protein n=1 Tax=Haloechinothrix alba TaxID=664784 RepID=A0A238ZUL9_9PSEU|nr:hypothetical protein [Haloechinothrix alba]SNR87116.1 hypothetical protein SAMN06265360_12612 [Haloechinothrix alba]